MRSGPQKKICVLTDPKSRLRGPESGRLRQSRGTGKTELLSSQAAVADCDGCPRQAVIRRCFFAGGCLAAAALSDANLLRSGESVQNAYNTKPNFLFMPTFSKQRTCLRLSVKRTEETRTPPNR